MLAVLAAYFLLLLALSRTGRRGAGNDTFFRAGRRSPWHMVAFGMIGASISGVSFISVPGWAASTGMTYLQMCAGFFFGYVAVACVLLPLYYRLGLTSIYSYLGLRYGPASHRAGALFFLLSKLTGAAARLYLVCLVLQQFVGGPLGIPYAATAAVVLFLIWAYTRDGGIHTLVRTDALQTLCLLLALGGMIWAAARAMGLDAAGVVRTVRESPMCRVLEWSPGSPQNFWRQFLSGVFIVVVMTGLDQDMMQKNLTCKTLREAQKDMCTYGFAFVPANLLFLSLGVLLVMLAGREGTALPAAGDELLPMFAATGSLGTTVVVLFTIGIVAASFSSADSALTSLTTSFCVDICSRPGDERLRRRAHIGICVLFVAFILLFRMLNSTSVIDAIYILCSYTYGPLLGLFAFGLLTRRAVCDRAVPWIAVASPLICFAADKGVTAATGYRFGYELLMLNGALTFAGLYLSGRKMRG